VKGQPVIDVVRFSYLAKDLPEFLFLLKRVQLFKLYSMGNEALFPTSST